MKSEKRTILIKGNPKYWVNRVSEKFYSDLNNIFNFTEKYESNILPSTIKPTGDNDVIVVFSRGCRYLKYFNEHRYLGKIITIGCTKKEIADGVDGQYEILHLTNPDDKTERGDLKMPSLKAHWTITPDMIKKIRNFI